MLCHDVVTSENHYVLKTFKLNQNTRFLQWARGHTKLKVVSADVPPLIFPQGVHGKLHDVKVFVKRGPDDSVYDSDEVIRNKVARGNCLLELSQCAEAGVRSVTYAMKKFTGGLGDDDDKEQGDNHTWKRYFIKPLSEARHVICTRKANGEAAHLSAVQIAGQIFIVGGSKNVHMLFRNKEDLNKYDGDRYRIAKEVCEAIVDLMDTITPDQKQRLLEFLCTKNVTAIFELLNPAHQHVEDLSYLKKQELKFIAWTSNVIEAEQSDTCSLCQMAPDTAIDIAREFGISTVDYERIDMGKVEERMQTIRRGYGYEGEVLYFVDHNNDVIGLLKKKTIWYIVCRAIREKVRPALIARDKNPVDFSTSRSENKIQKRLKEIQSWLNLDDLAVTKWIDLGCSFLGWILDKSRSEGVLPDKATALFPVYWSQFLAEQDKSDKIDVKWEEPGGSDD